MADEGLRLREWTLIGEFAVRTLAWTCVIIGLLISLLSPIGLRREEQIRWEICLKGNFRAPSCQQEPAAPAIGFLYGLPAIAFGILLLAIRRPEK